MLLYVAEKCLPFIMKIHNGADYEEKRMIYC